MEKRFAGSMTDLFLQKQPTNMVMIQLKVLQILRDRYAGRIRNRDVDTLVQEVFR